MCRAGWGVCVGEWKQGLSCLVWTRKYIFLLELSYHECVQKKETERRLQKEEGEKSMIDPDELVNVSNGSIKNFISLAKQQTKASYQLRFTASQLEV